MLRPGVIVSCGAAGSDGLRAATGAPVKDRNGKQYVTVSSRVILLL